MSPFIRRLVRRLMTWQGITLCIVIINVIGMIGLKVMEPQASWLDSALWTTMALWTFGLDMFAPTSTASRVFQALFLQFAFPVTVVVATLAIPPFLEFREAPKKGLAEINFNRHALYLLVDAVDWEKARSIYNELVRRFGKKFQLVVVSETLIEIPADLLDDDVQFVYGSLRDEHTYLRAGLKRAKGVFVCVSSYQKVSSDTVTQGIVAILEQVHPDVRTVVEVVSAESLDLFQGQHAADHTVVFDPTVLAAAVKLLVTKLDGKAARLSYPIAPADNAQASEIARQLTEAGVRLNWSSGIPVRLILPRDLDDPAKSDFETQAELKRARAAGEVVVAIYLSVLSKRLFRGYENDVICADEIMAQALGAAMAQ